MMLKLLRRFFVGYRCAVRFDLVFPRACVLVGPPKPECGGEWAAKTVKRCPQLPAKPQCANYWAPPVRKRNHREHGPQRPSEHSDLMQHAKGRTGDCPGPHKETPTRQTSCPPTHSEAAGGRSKKRLSLDEALAAARDFIPHNAPYCKQLLSSLKYAQIDPCIVSAVSVMTYSTTCFALQEIAETRNCAACRIHAHMHTYIHIRSYVRAGILRY